MDLTKINFSDSIEDAVHGDRDACEFLYTCTFGCFRRTASDLIGTDRVTDQMMQDVYVRIFGELGSLEDPQQFLPWGTSVTRSAVIAYYKTHLSQTAERYHADVSAEDYPSSVYDRNINPNAKIDAAEGQQVLRSLLDGLPAGQRICVTLWAQNDSLQQITEKTGLRAEDAAGALKDAKQMIGRRLSVLSEKGLDLCGMAPLPYFILLCRNSQEVIPQPDEAAAEKHSPQLFESILRSVLLQNADADTGGQYEYRNPSDGRHEKPGKSGFGKKKILFIVILCVVVAAVIIAVPVFRGGNGKASSESQSDSETAAAETIGDPSDETSADTTTQTDSQEEEDTEEVDTVSVLAAYAASANDSYLSGGFYEVAYGSSYFFDYASVVPENPLCWYIFDADGDGDEELLIIDTQYRTQDESSVVYNDAVLSLYEMTDDGTVSKAADDTVSAGVTAVCEDGFVEWFVYDADGAVYLGCETYGYASHFADGVSKQITMLTYDSGGFTQVLNWEVSGSDFYPIEEGDTQTIGDGEVTVTFDFYNVMYGAETICEDYLQGDVFCVSDTVCVLDEYGDVDPDEILSEITFTGVNTGALAGIDVRRDR